MTTLPPLAASLNLASLDRIENDPRQTALDATSPIEADPDQWPVASMNGICWHAGDTSIAAIDDVQEFEFCYPGRALTHEEAAKVLREEFANRAGKWHSHFVGAEQDAEAQALQDAAEARADAAYDNWKAEREWGGR